MPVRLFEKTIISADKGNNMELPPHIRPYLEEVERMMEAELGGEDRRVYGMLTPFVRRGGKRIRPTLLFFSCGAVGGDCRTAVETAAVIELFHNFTLIHDDIEDDSRFRRGEPTLHVTYGVPIALNSGDALYTLLWRKLVSLEMPPARLLRLEKMCAEAFKKVVDGQGIELSWIREGRFDVKEEEYFQMISGKTSALMGLACEAGAMLGGGTKPQTDALRAYGEKIGSAFQIQDDVLNVRGDFEKYQKEIGGDISEGKRTLLVVHCLGKANDVEKKQLVSILSSHTKNQGEIGEVIGLLDKYRSMDYANERALRLVEEAKGLLRALPDSRDRKALLELADYVVHRER
jgi:geranylgeranyl pyrophosphate synthase